MGRRDRRVDSGSDREQGAVADTLLAQAQVGSEPPTMDVQPVAGVDRRRVEQPDCPGEVGHQLGDRDPARDGQIAPPPPSDGGDPEQSVGHRQRAQKSKRAAPRRSTAWYSAFDWETVR